jgi:hypothetical protein
MRPLVYAVLAEEMTSPAKPGAEGPIIAFSAVMELSSRNQRRKLPLLTHYIATPPDGFDVVLAA